MLTLYQTAFRYWTKMKNNPCSRFYFSHVFVCLPFLLGIQCLEDRACGIHVCTAHEIISCSISNMLVDLTNESIQLLYLLKFKPWLQGISGFIFGGNQWFLTNPTVSSQKDEPISSNTFLEVPALWFLRSQEVESYGIIMLTCLHHENLYRREWPALQKWLHCKR